MALVQMILTRRFITQNIPLSKDYTIPRAENLDLLPQIDSRVDTINTNTNFTRNSNLIANGSAVRSVQRGIAGIQNATHNPNDIRASRTITISAVNLAKTQIIIDNLPTDKSQFGQMGNMTLTSTGIVQQIFTQASGQNNAFQAFSWEIIEYF